MLTWFRWSVVVFLQSVILFLIWWQRVREPTGEAERVLKGKVVETGGDINGLYQTSECSVLDVNTVLTIFSLTHIHVSQAGRGEIHTQHDLER